MEREGEKLRKMCDADTFHLIEFHFITPVSYNEINRIYFLFAFPNISSRLFWTDATKRKFNLTLIVLFAKENESLRCMFHLILISA